MSFPIPPYLRTYGSAPARQCVLRRWLQVVAGRYSAPCDVVVIGDEITEYGTATTLANGYVRQFKANLLSLFPTPGVPISGTGLLASGSPGYLPITWATVATRSLSDAPVLSSPPPSFNSMTNMYGIADRSSTFQNSSQTWTMTTNASAWDVFYTGLTTGTHNFSYKLDAGAVTPFTTAGFTAVSPGQRVRLGPLASPGTSHTLQLAGSTGSPIIEGVYVYNGDEASGIRVWEAGYLGATTGTWLTNGILPLQLLSYIQPALVVIALGIKDFNGALTPAAITGNLNGLISTVRSYCTVPPSLVLFIEHPIIAAFAYREPWDNYVQALYQYALNDGDIYVVDMNERVGNPPAQIASLSTGTPGLPNDIAHKMWADALAYALLP